MIIAEITDGLGNQMFQYAAARCLAIRRNTTLKLDLFHFTCDDHRRYGLGDFNIRAKCAHWLDVARLCPTEAGLRLIRRLRPRRLRAALLRGMTRRGWTSHYRPRTRNYSPDLPLPPLLIGRVVSERFYQYDPGLLTCPDNVCLSGYWQNERYFSEIAETLRKEFSVKAPLRGKNLEVARLMAQTPSVSLHVRRGDKATDARHFATSREDCQRAIRFFRERLANPVFFVFSDDWPWVEANLETGPDVVSVNHNDPDQAAEDLRLMSLCKHQIIAASTFSWWGAWLNANPDKIVLHPGHVNWLRIDNHDASEIFPRDWVSIDAETPGVRRQAVP